MYLKAHIISSDFDRRGMLVGDICSPNSCRDQKFLNRSEHANKVKTFFQFLQYNANNKNQCKASMKVIVFH